jgi:hypothetical protein
VERSCPSKRFSQKRDRIKLHLLNLPFFIVFSELHGAKLIQDTLREKGIAYRPTISKSLWREGMKSVEESHIR